MDCAGGSQGGRDIDWGAIFARLSERYGFTPAEIGDLTYPQVRAYIDYLGEHPWPYTVSVVPRDGA